jgi:phosphonate transport system substrate-binding protein
LRFDWLKVEAMPRIAGFLMATLLALLNLSQGQADKPLTVGLFPDGLTQAERAPLRDYLSQAMGQPVSLLVPERYAETLAHLADGSYDFACLGGLSYLKAHASDGVVAVVQRSSDRHNHAVFITGANSSIYSLSDLNGKQFAFGDINSTAGHLIPDRELRNAGINPDTDLKFRYSGSHPVTAALVEAGVVDAGAMDETVFRSMIASKKIDSEKVRIFYTSEKFVDWVYVARRGVPVAEREKFAAALLALKPEQNDDVLKLLGTTQFVRANDEEYAPLRRIAKQLGLF